MRQSVSLKTHSQRTLVHGFLIAQVMDQGRHRRQRAAGADVRAVVYRASDLEVRILVPAQVRQGTAL